MPHAARKRRQRKTKHAVIWLYGFYFLPFFSVPLPCRHHQAKRALRNIADWKLYLCRLPSAVQRHNENLIPRRRPENIIAAADKPRVCVDIPCEIERNKLPRRKRRIFITKTNQPTCLIPQGSVAALPIVGRAIIGIAKALHADLVPVIKGRHSRIRHLPEQRQLHALFP